MTETHDSRAEHPEALLAEYADGTLRPADQDTVESHVASCERCRAELSLARHAVAAVASLAEVEPAGVDVEAILAGAGSAPRDARKVAPVRALGSPRRRPGWAGRLAWAGGIAAAAAVATLVVLAVNGPSQRSNLAAPRASSKLAPEASGRIRHLPSYDPKTLGELAKALAASQPPDSPVPVPSGTDARLTAGLPTESAVDCLRRAAGVRTDAVTTYVDASAWEGSPAFIGAFRTGAGSETSDALLVLAVSRQGCRPYYILRQAL